MSEFQLHNDVFITPTSLGCHYLISDVEMDPPRRVLRDLMMSMSSPRSTEEHLQQWEYNGQQLDSVLELLYRMETVGWIRGQDKPLTLETDRLEQGLTSLLEECSMVGKALLADGQQGFSVANVGFAHEEAEELSGLSAEISTLQGKYRKLINNNIKASSAIFGITDASGISQMGFMPLYIGKHQFVLITKGVARLNHVGFLRLIWALFIRYGE